MLNTLTDTHGGRMLSALRQQIEESRLQSLYGCFGVNSPRELFRKIKEAQEAATQAKKHSILNLGSAFPSRAEMMREVERINSSPVRKVYRELKEICEQANRENEETERRESLQTIIRNHRKDLAAQFAKPRFEVEPVRLSKPFKLKLEINVIINPASAEGTN